MPNPQYWITALLNAWNDPRSKNASFENLVGFLYEVIRGSDSTNAAILKLITHKVKKAADWLPAIEYCLSCYLDGETPKKMPKVLTFNGIQHKYAQWFDENYETYEEETEDATEE
jgi:hypothetical protein